MELSDIDDEEHDKLFPLILQQEPLEDSECLDIELDEKLDERELELKLWLLELELMLLSLRLSEDDEQL